MMAETIPCLMGPFDPSAKETFTDMDLLSSFHHEPVTHVMKQSSSRQICITSTLQDATQQRSFLTTTAETIPYLMGPFDPTAEDTFTDMDIISTTSSTSGTRSRPLRSIFQWLSWT